MGNLYNDGVWILDTAHVSAFLLGVTNDIEISKMKWEPNGAGDTLIIKDINAYVKISETSLAATPAGDMTFDFQVKPLRIKGPVLHTMTAGGVLYVYLA